MGSAGQLARSFRRREPSHRRNERPLLSTRTTWVIVAVSVLSRSALSTMVALMLWSLLPNLVGFQTTTVMSGSMEPRLQVGDAIVVRHIDAAQLTKGQVLLFDDPDHPGQLRMHRLLRIGRDGRLVTKGDANEEPDSSTIRFDAVHGAAFLRIPFAGLPAFWLRTGQPMPLLLGCGLVVLLVGGARTGRLLEDAEERERRRHRGVRLHGAHRATAAGVALLVVVAAGGVVAPGAGAEAAYSAATAPAASTWGTLCGDIAPDLSVTGTPLFYWGYGTSSGANVADLSGRADAGGLLGDAARSSCLQGAGPSLSVGSSGGGAVVEQPSSARPYPGDTTVATWFKTTSAGGTLADFGSSRTGGSSSVDKVLYMQADGNITFASATLSLLSLTLGSMYCTSTSSTGYADGSWHLAVATYSDATGCTLTIDNGTPVTTTPTLTLKALTGFSGYWRFGGDAVSSSTWTGATARPYFIGALDESQVYSSVLSPSARAAIFARWH